MCGPRLNIDLTKMSSLEGNNKKARELCSPKNHIWMLGDGLSKHLRRSRTNFGSQIFDGLDKTWCYGPVWGMQPLDYGWVGNKSRLFASWIGKDERLDQAKILIWETLNLIYDEVDHGKTEMKVSWEKSLRRLWLVTSKKLEHWWEKLEELAKAYKNPMW